MKKIISKLGIILLLVAGLGTLLFFIKVFKIASELENADEFSVSMVTDGGGINDQSFQQSAWEGLQRFSKSTGTHVSYIECAQISDAFSNLDKLSDVNTNLIYAVGFKMADALKLAAKANPEINFCIADFSYGDETPENITGITFRAEESSFLVGYIAACTTKTNCVGFIGGIKGMVIDQFEYGYRAGVAYGAKKLNKDIVVKVQYAESFTDSAKGKAIATNMYGTGSEKDCDIVFHAAGGAGMGVIESAKETGNFAIGADMDQSYLAPKNVLTSSIKNVGMALEIISQKALDGENIGGKTYSFGIKEGCVGIPENNPNISQDVLEKVRKIQEKISSGEIVPPGTKENYDEFVNKTINNLNI